MKHHAIAHRRIALATAAVLALGACADDANRAADTTLVDAPPPSAAGSPATRSVEDVLESVLVESERASGDISVPATGDLTMHELAGLWWIREEEQLAHDVYVALGERWDLRIFENIAESETSHIDAMVGLLEELGIDDPAAGNEPGTFTDPAMQALYDGFIEQGSRSPIDALEVGAIIEELDIGDLRDRAEETDVAAIEQVYERLARGSRNHLRAFISQLEARDVVYVPVALGQSEFDAIVSSPRERGGRDA